MTEKQILEKSLVLFNQKGYAQVGMRELARELSISPGNLTYYFKKKEDVLSALLKQFSSHNTQLYQTFQNVKPTNANFLRLTRSIFENQYAYRGVYIGNQFVQKAITENNLFEYEEVVIRRKDAYSDIFRLLENSGHLKLKGDDVSFLVAYMTLFGRFWITEATLFNKVPKSDEVISHYIHLLAKQLSLFSTNVGLISIEEFLKVDGS